VRPCTRGPGGAPKRDGRHPSGYQRYRCRVCRRTFTERDYRAKLSAAGFADAEVRVTRTYGLADLADDDGEGSCCGGPTDAPAADLAASEGALASAFVRATKPA
jgi:hypothetical protein